MNLHLKPETEAKLAAYAAAQGVSVDAYLEALVEKELGLVDGLPRYLYVEYQ